MCNIYNNTYCKRIIAYFDGKVRWSDILGFALPVKSLVTLTVKRVKGNPQQLARWRIRKRVRTGSISE